MYIVKLSIHLVSILNAETKMCGWKPGGVSSKSLPSKHQLEKTPKIYDFIQDLTNRPRKFRIPQTPWPNSLCFGIPATFGGDRDPGSWLIIIPI